MTTLRGATGVSFNANAVTLTLPAGTVAGDWAAVFGYNGYLNPVLSNITGWTTVSKVTSFGDAVYAYKQLTAADITAGSVTITWSGAYSGYAAIATVLASVGNNVDINAGSASNGDTAISRTIYPALKNGDVAIYFAAKRADASTPTVTISRGTLVNASGTADVGGAVYTEALAADNSSAVTATYSLAGGNVDVVAAMAFSDVYRTGGTVTDAMVAAGAVASAASLLYKGRTTAAADAGGVP